MRKKRCTLKNGNSKNIINGVVKQNKCLDIKKLYLRNAPKRPGYRPIPGVSVYPQNFKSPRIIKEGTYKDKALDICHDSISEEQSSCRCGDVITCPGSQEFRCNNSDKSDHVEENFISSCKPVDFRGLTVPDVLLSGHHANINKWREEQRKRLTAEKKGDNHE